MNKLIKKIISLYMGMVWIGVGGISTHTASAADSYRDITLTTAGTLIDSLATGNRKIDSLIVRGPINDFDFSALRDIAKYNESIVINLAYADVENKTIPEFAFYNDKIKGQIKRIILPEDIHTIEPHAFFMLYGLKDINMPPSLRELGEGAFMGCTGLAPDTLKFPEGLETIHRQCFDNCTHLKHIVFPKSLKHIKTAAFNQDYWIQSITFQEGLESIGFMAFTSAGIIDTIRLPESVTTIEEAAFAQTWSLKYINIPAGVTTIPVEFAVSSILDSIYIPDNVITIKESAFSGILCSYLRLSENLCTIEREAFRDHRLTEVLLPASLQFIGNKALPADRLKKVYCPATIPPALESTDKGLWAFTGCGENTTLFVPIGCGETYRNTPGWSNFPNIEEIAEFPSSIDKISTAFPWTATTSKGIIFLKNNAATAVNLSIHALGGELIREIMLQDRSAIEVTPGSYLISDGQNGKTIIVK